MVLNAAFVFSILIILYEVYWAGVRARTGTLGSEDEESEDGDNSVAMVTAPMNGTAAGGVVVGGAEAASGSSTARVSDECAYARELQFALGREGLWGWWLLGLVCCVPFGKLGRILHAFESFFFLQLFTIICSELAPLVCASRPVWERCADLYFA